MSPSILFVVGLAISSAMLSGLLFVFSNFAMKAFSNIPVESGVSSMQSINSAILNPGFFGLFSGTATGSLGVLVIALRHWEHPASSWIVAGALLCLIGCFLVTASINVPLNHQLDKVDPSAANAAEAWKDYLTRWQPWNHVRTIATLMAAAAYAVGALKMAGA
ncbi:MAG: anthrone oxygenase family protein [Haloferula sp.]